MSDDGKDAPKIKTVEMLTPHTKEGSAIASLTSETGETYVGKITRAREGDPVEPGATVIATQAIEGEERKRKVIGQYTRKGPPKAATPRYRQGYDAVNWGPKPPRGQMN